MKFKKSMFFIVALLFLSEGLLAQCSINGESCCLRSSDFQKIKDLGLKNRKTKYGNQDILVGRWSTKEVEKMTEKTYKPGSSAAEKNKFFQFYQKGWSQGTRAGSGIYVVLPFANDPEKFKQLESSNDFAGEKDPSFFFMVLGGPKLMVIQQNEELGKILKQIPGYSGQDLGNVWEHFDRFCSDKLPPESIYFYTDTDTNWAVVKGNEAIKGYKALGSVVNCKSLQSISKKMKDFSDPAKSVINLEKNKICR